MLKKLSVFFLAVAFIFLSFGTVFGYGTTYETLIASDSGGSGVPVSITGTYAWNAVSATYEHATDVYFIDEYAPGEYWIHDGVEPLYSSVGALYDTNYNNFGVVGYGGTVAMAGGDTFATPPVEGTFAGLGATLNPTDIGGHMVDLFAQVWVIVAFALAIPLALYLIWKIRESVPVEVSDRKAIKRASERARKEHQREIRRN